jgi:DNA replication protein DnaC
MCPGCQKAATIRELAEREEERQRDIAAGRRKVIESRIATAGIPVRFRECTFDGFVVNPGPMEAKQTTALRVCRAFAERWENVQRKGSVLVMTGSTGTGKTHLACAIANAVMQQHSAAVAFGTVSDHVRSVKSAFQKDSDRSEQSAIQALVEPDLLIMDELGQRMTEYDQQLIFDVMNARYAAMRPMVLMTNLTLDDLNGILGDRLADRLREVGAFVSLAWPSYRVGK